jgi:hypothetical protein
MSVAIPWFVELGVLLGATIILVIVVGRRLWYACWLLLTLVVGIGIRRDGPFGRLITRLLNKLFGTPTTDEQRYGCDCGAPMTNSGAYSRTQYRVEHWECTDDDCRKSGQAYIFDNEMHNYGEGVLDGQVNP